MRARDLAHDEQAQADAARRAGGAEPRVIGSNRPAQLLGRDRLAVVVDLDREGLARRCARSRAPAGRRRRRSWRWPPGCRHLGQAVGSPRQAPLPMRSCSISRPGKVARSSSTRRRPPRAGRSLARHREAAADPGHGEVEQVAIRRCARWVELVIRSSALRCGPDSSRGPARGAQLDHRERVAQVVADDADHLLGEQGPVLGAGALPVELGLRSVSASCTSCCRQQQLLGAPAREQQLVLVLVAVLGDEDGDLVQRAPRVIALRTRVQHHRQRAAVAMHARRASPRPPSPASAAAAPSASGGRCGRPSSAGPGSCACRPAPRPAGRASGRRCG